MKPLLASFLFVLPVTALAGSGAYEINQDCAAVGCFTGSTAGFPVTISHSGSYILTSDIATGTSTGLAAISVTASPVDIDLNGHTIDGGATCTGSPVTSCTGFNIQAGIYVKAGTNVPSVAHIHNGTIRGFGNSYFGGGVQLVFADDGTLLDHLTLTQNVNGVSVLGNTGVSTIRIRDSQIVRNQYYGVTESGGVLNVENNAVVGNGSRGLFLSPGSTAFGNRINSNTLEGIYCTGGACAIGLNTFSGNHNSSSSQYTITTVNDMGGNVCLDRTTTSPPGTCP